jgi:hypothetical protein
MVAYHFGELLQRVSTLPNLTVYRQRALHEMSPTRFKDFWRE